MEKKYTYEEQRERIKEARRVICANLALEPSAYKKFLFEYGCRLVAEQHLDASFLKEKKYWNRFQYQYFLNDVKWVSEVNYFELSAYKEWKEAFISDPVWKLRVFDFINKF